jgi:hypothetical protein
MDGGGRRRRTRELAVIVALFAIAILASPLRALWARPSVPWWTILVIWAVIITLGGLAIDRWGRDDR